jgi:quaternary ammonium compound-resistance protein SugE
VRDSFGLTAMPWLMLLIAGVLEVGWAIGLKYSEGFSRLVPSLFTLAAMALSFLLLAQSLRAIPVGTGYAVWTGIGASGTAILGMILFAEPATVPRIAALAMIVSGILLLRWTSS